MVTFKELYNQAVLNYKTGDLDHSLQLVNQALIMKPKSDLALHLKAMIYKKQNRLEDASELYRQAIQNCPDHGKKTQLRAFKSEIDSQINDISIDELIDFGENSPESVISVDNPVSDDFEIVDNKKLKASFDQELYDNLINKAQVLLDAEDYPQSLECLNQIIQMTSFFDNSFLKQIEIDDMYVARAHVHKNLGSNLEAEMDIEHALQINPDNADAPEFQLYDDNEEQAEGIEQNLSASDDAHIMESDLVIEEEEEYEKEDSDLSIDSPLFLFISPIRLILMSILAPGLYPMYWMYKNYSYIRNRYSEKMEPFGRAIFFIFFIFDLMRRIHEDPVANKVAKPKFSYNILGPLFIISVIFQVIFVNFISNVAVSVFCCLLFIVQIFCLVQIQLYINEVTVASDPDIEYYPLISSGHIIVAILGICWWAIMIGLKIAGIN